MAFELHDEGEHRAAEEFLSDFLGPVSRLLLQLLGRAPAEPVHVILSHREKHAERFPPSIDQLVDLEDLSEIPDNEREEHLRRFPTATYAHGVTTIAAASHDPPVGLSVGQLAVFLDIDTIEEIADQVGVLFEAMLGRVAAHELSHAMRGHAVDGGTATHGWFNEGDAQRDAWHVLGELLADPAWTSLARLARAAQVRLSDRQPSAYRMFETDWTERSRLADDPLLDRVTSWILTPPRDVFVLSRLSVSEAPVAVAARRIMGAPSVGDQMYLADRDLIAGPWVVVAARRDSRTQHPKDLTAVERLAKNLRAKPELEWLVLRPLGLLMAACESAVSPAGDLVAKRLEGSELARLVADLDRPADELADSVAQDAIQSHRETVDEINEMRRRAGQAPEDVPVTDIDPFDDWR